MAFIVCVLMGTAASIYGVSRGFYSAHEALMIVCIVSVSFLLFILMPLGLVFRHLSKRNITWHTEMFSEYYHNEYTTVRDLEWFKREYKRYENNIYNSRRIEYLFLFPFMLKPEKYVLEEFPNDYYDRLADAARKESNN